MTHEQFQVDLRGIVEILSHHLYSSPRVYLRELVQNARDAIIAADDLHAASGGRMVIDTSEPDVLRVCDNGIGLTEHEVRTFLATIGSSSKRDDLALARSSFLGQFGIGLLSCFLIADEIVVRTRSARSAQAPTLLWVGRSDGTYTVRAADQPLPVPGTEVLVRARADARDWVQPQRVERIAREFAQHLSERVDLLLPDGQEVAIAPTPAPWELTGEELQDYCRETFGFRPLDAIPLAVPAAGVVGLAFVLPREARAGSRAGDVVYLRRMLLSRKNTQLVPDWAFFVRVVLDAGSLAPTASREELKKGGLLQDVQHAIGKQITQHIDQLAQSQPERFERFQSVHHTALVAMACSDDNLLRLVYRHLPLKTAIGRRTLREIVEQHGAIDYLTSRPEFNAAEPMACLAERPLVDGFVAYVPQLMTRLAERRPDLPVRHLTLRDVVADLPELDDPRAATLLRTARRELSSVGAQVRLVAFEPREQSALFVPADPNFGSADRQDEWADLMGEISDGSQEASAVLLLNFNSPPVAALCSAATDVQAAGVRALHAISVLSGGRSLDPDAAQDLAGALAVLVREATDQEW